MALRADKLTDMKWLVFFVNRLLLQAAGFSQQTTPDTLKGRWRSREMTLVDRMPVNHKIF
jgi:hypothetical protein